MSSGQGRTGLLISPVLPLLSTSNTLMMAGHAPVQWHQHTRGDWKMPGFPGTAYAAVLGQAACGPGAQAGLSYPGSRSLLRPGSRRH